MTSQDEAWDRLRRQRLIEHQQLAAVQGITLPAMPPRLPGETDREYGVRLAGIAKSHCGPPPRPKHPPKPLPRPSTGKAGKADKSNYQPPPPDGERLAAMTPDPTTEDEP